MPNILIRNLDGATVDRLKQRAKRHGRSLQAEARLALEQAAGSEQVAALLDAWQVRLAGRQFASSSELIREDRER